MQIVMLKIWLALWSMLPGYEEEGTRLHTIEMKNMRFIPKKIEITVGDTIRWINEGDMPHNVVANNKHFKSKMVRRGQQFQHIFNTPGTYDYFCQPHKMMGMKGTVTVVKKEL